MGPLLPRPSHDGVLPRPVLARVASKPSTKLSAENSEHVECSQSSQSYRTEKPRAAQLPLWRHLLHCGACLRRTYKHQCCHSRGTQIPVPHSHPCYWYCYLRITPINSHSTPITASKEEQR